MNNNPNTAQAIATAMVRTLKWIASSDPETIVAKVPPEFYASDPAVYREALRRNLPSFSPNGLLPHEAANNVYKAMVKFDPTLVDVKIDLPATYQNKFVEQALKNAN